MACPDCSGPCGEAARLAAILADLRRFRSEIVAINTNLDTISSSTTSFQAEIVNGFAKDDNRTDGPLTNDLLNNIETSQSSLSNMLGMVDEKIAYYEPLYQEAQRRCDECNAIPCTEDAEE